MIKLDRIRMLIPYYCFEGVEQKDGTEALLLFEDRPMVYDELLWTFNKRQLPVGVNEMRVIYKKGLRIDITAKVLGKEYPQLLHSGTIRHALNTTLKGRLIGYDLDQIIQHSEVYLLHVTRDLHQQVSVAETLMVLSHVHHRKFNTVPYDSNIVYTERAKKRARRLSIYDKQMELKRQRKFLAINGKEYMLQAFQDTLRIELELKKKPILRKYFQEVNGVITLLSVLKSQSNPIADTFSEIVADVKEDAEEIPLPGTISKIEKLFGQMTIVKNEGYDINRIRYLVYQNSGGNPSRKMLEYTNLVKKMMNIRVYEQGGYSHIARLRKVLEEDAE